MSNDRPPRVRLTPDERRTQLLDLGVELLATRSFEELSVDLLAEEAGISRGLLYHYFGTMQDYREAVVRRAVDDLLEQTAPPVEGDPITRLLVSVAAYVDYVVANYDGYVSVVRGASSGAGSLPELYAEARAALTGRIFATGVEEQVVTDTPRTRLVVRGWSAMVEELVVTWARDPGTLTRDELVETVATSLPALVGCLPSEVAGPPVS